MSALPLWSWEAAGEALAAISRASGLSRPAASAPRAPEGLDADQLGAWLEAAGAWLGLEVEDVSAPYPDVDGLLLHVGPALIAVPAEGDAPGGLLAVLGGRRGRLRALSPSLMVVAVPVAAARRALTAGLERRHGGVLSRVLAAGELEGPRAAVVRDALLRQVLSAETVAGCWMLRLPPSAPLLPQLRAAGVTGALGWMVAAHALEVGALIGAWATLGRGALGGGLDPGWLLAWALLLLTVVPFRMVTVWAQGRLSLGFGGVLKRRLLLGALRLTPEEVRHQGAGQLLGRVIESEAVEALALSGGLLAVVALVELGMAAAVLARGAGGLGQSALLGLWALVAVGLTALVLRARDRWTVTRLEITHALVERMVGHRTRLAQLAPDRWHDGEDQALARYLGDAGRMDGASAASGALLPGGWVLVGLLGLAPAFVSGDAPAALAVALGGVLLALQALQALGGGLSAIGGAWIAWRQVAPLYHAAAREEPRPAPTLTLARRGDGAERASPEPLLEAHDLGFRYPGRGDHVFRGATLTIRRGDRLLLEGPSGGGKSTLASLLVGSRAPSAGLLLLRGLDRATLGGAGWRRRVAAAPQFHENHVLTGTFAFNLLMGRRWPGTPADHEEAEALCHALGLGPLLARMPAGMGQMVGETGWQLSHGEKSRLFLARALLQDAELIVLDESFAALDPENLAVCLSTTLARAPALVVIAHP